MDAQEWRKRIEAAKESDTKARERFMAVATEYGIEHAAEWDLRGVTEARVNLGWWTRIEKRLGDATPLDLAAIEEVIESAHYDILTANTNASTNPVANAIRGCERDTLARWYREAAGMLQRSKRDGAAAAVATTAEVK